MTHMKKAKKIVVLGSTNTDMTIHDKRLPVAGETISGGTFMMSPGGKGANQAVAVARLSAVRGERSQPRDVRALHGRPRLPRRRRRVKSLRRLSRLGVPFRFMVYYAP